MKVLVQCTYQIEIEVPDEDEEWLEFDIEDNHCPGTGKVGSALEKCMAHHEQEGTCWACALQGENKIISINGIPYNRSLTILGIDTETTGVDRYHGAAPFFVTVCDHLHQQTYWEADVDPFTREPQWERDDLIQMRKMLTVNGEMKVIQNSKFDIPMLDNILPGLEDSWDWEHTYDTLISAHLVCSNAPHDLTNQVLIHLDYSIKPVEDALEKATASARRMCRTKDFIARHGQWLIADEGIACMPSAKEKTWKFDMWLPRAVAKAEWELTGDTEWRPPSEEYEGYHPWWTVLAEYSNPDSAALIPLHNAHVKIIHQRDLWQIYLERLKILPQLCAMEKRGVTLSKSRLEELEERFTACSESAGNYVTNLAASYDGYELVLPKNGMNNSLREFLFDKMGLQSPIKTDKGEPSFDKNAVEHFMLTLPGKSRELKFVEKLREKRSADTARGYLASYRKYWLPEDDEIHLIHSKVNPTGTDTLRNSSNDPNSQQVSKKEGFNLRYAFGPRPGREWWSIDYDNLELRIPAYESGEKVMIDIFEKPDEAPYFGSYHLLNASIVYPDLFWPLADKKGAFKEKYGATYYQWIKNFDFADQYGAMLGSGTADLAAHKPGAQAMVQARLKEKNKLNNKYIDLANRWGFVETIPDKEINPNKGYPVYCARSKYGKVSPTIPLNYHVQSTACWVKMRAMFKVEEYLRKNRLDGYIILEIHDELIFDFPFVPNKGNLHHLNNIRNIMASLGDCVGIPLTCGLSYHPNNWSMSV